MNLTQMKLTQMNLPTGLPVPISRAIKRLGRCAILAVTALSVSLPAHAGFESFRNFPLRQITPAGWQKAYLIKQRDGLTGQLDQIAEPFTRFRTAGWVGTNPEQIASWKEPFYLRKNKEGKNVVTWEPFEQTGYYYDGVIRAGLLLHDESLLNKARFQIDGAMASASSEGVIGADIPDRWPHVCFFRACMAAQESSDDHKILDAMERHYDNDKFDLAGCRSIINIEQLVWLYQQTGHERHLKRAIDLYEAQAKRGTDRQVNDFNDLNSDARQDIHGVTFHETLKLPILLYMETGEKKYLDAARNGFRKLDQFHMLPDGVPATEEGLSGKSSIACHETCDVSDFMWATLYMLKATGEVEWADKIERAALNAGLAVVTKDFDAHQYLSSVNQIVSQLGSGTSPIGNEVWGAYAQRQMPLCCTGNVNRIFPIYVGAQWLRGKGDALVKALYGPSRCVHTVNGKNITIEEVSTFPFSGKIELRITEGSANFPLHLRIPTWAKAPSVAVNGIKHEGVASGKFLVLEREFQKGDVIALDFPMEPETSIVEMNGATVSYGPLLFALPVAAKIQKVLLRENVWGSEHFPMNSPDIYAYNMTPASKWRYVLALDGKLPSGIEVIRNPGADMDHPWSLDSAPLELRVAALHMPGWPLFYQEYRPFFQPKETVMVPVTPPLPPRGCMTMTHLKCDKPEKIALLPYGATTLRIGVFPYWDIKDIPSFQENQINYQR